MIRQLVILLFIYVPLANSSISLSQNAIEPKLTLRIESQSRSYWPILKPGEVGFSVNQVLLVAAFRMTEEITAPDKPAQERKETYQSVFRLLAEGSDRNRFAFQFELSQPGTKTESRCIEVYAERWYDFSAVVVESPPRPVIPTVETEGGPSPKAPPNVTTPIGMSDLPTPDVVDLWWDWIPRYVGWHLISAGTLEALELGIESPAGAVITSVNPASPAEAAGLSRGDWVVAFRGWEIDTPEDLQALLLQCDLGSRQTVRVSSSVKFTTRDTELMIEQDQRDRKQYGEYAHPYVGWTIRLPRDWKLDPHARRNESSGKVYDSIRSANDNLTLCLAESQT